MSGRAFTLIEVLVVAAVVALLAGILLPVLHRAKAASRISSATSALRQQYICLEMYASDNDGAGQGDWKQMGFPPSEGNEVLKIIPRSLWISPCGIHPYFEPDGAPMLATFQVSFWEDDWPSYVNRLGTAAALVRDAQCDDHSQDLRNPYLMHLGLAVRLDGSIWRKRGPGDVTTLQFYDIASGG